MCAKIPGLRKRIAAVARVATDADIPALNHIFSDAFSERYRRDGMYGVRVPPLNPAIWKYAIADAGEGALMWVDSDSKPIAFNMIHRSGTEGWMGPLCVQTGFQGAGLGREMVETGMDLLRKSGAKVIGLETMPRTMDNIGFYSRLGFVPGHLTITLTLDAAPSNVAFELLSRCSLDERESVLRSCRDATDALLPGCDFTREIELTEVYRLGDTLLLGTKDNLRGYALWHTSPLVEGRTRDELRVLKLLLQRPEDLPDMMVALCNQALKAGTRRVSVRLQGGYTDAYRQLLAMGARVRWTDLRMSVHGWNERYPNRGLVLSNWEI